MSILLTIGAFIGTVVSTVSSICAGIGGSVKVFAGALAAVLPKVAGTIEILNQIVRGIGAIVGYVADLFGLKDADETPEEIGFKAHKCEKSSAEFDSYSDYIEHIRNEVEFDKAEFEALKEEEKTAYTIVGSSILAKGIEEKTNVAITPEFLSCAGQLKLSPEEFFSCIESFKTRGIATMTDMVDYLSGKHTNIDTSKVFDAIVGALKNAGVVEGDINSRIYDMKAVVRDSNLY